MIFFFYNFSIDYNENYSLYYEKRARDRNQCAFDGEWEDTNIPSGRTYFSKIRIDLHSLSVFTDDYTFARTYGRRPQPFATGGDCFSSTEQCPRGGFSINFESTKFRIKPQVNWEISGHNTTMRFRENGVSEEARKSKKKL